MWRPKDVSTKKILFYYSLAIVLPCIVLGILAFRGVRNDQALIERENQRRLQEIGEGLSSSLLDHLDSIKQAFRQLENIETLTNIDYFSDSILAGFVQSNPTLMAVVAYQPQSSIAIPKELILYLPDDPELRAPQEFSNKASGVISAGWNYEFRDRNYTAAIRYYTATLKGLKDSTDRAMIVNIMARIYRKQEDQDKAIAAYQQIAKEYASVYLPGGIPAGLTARRELIKLYQGLQLHDKTQEELGNLLDMLLKAQHPVQKAYFQNTREELSDILGSIGTISPELKSKLKNFEDAETRTKYLHHFQSIDETVSDLILNPMSRTNTFFFRSNNLPYFFSYMVDADRSWILLYDVDQCFSEVLTPMLDEQTTNLGFNWLEDSKESVLKTSSEEPQTIYYLFPDYLPDWKIEFTPVQRGTMRSLLLSPQGIYFYIFLLILVILLFGLFFTLQAINQELKVSKMKSIFISAVSHEFKSPITSIRQMAEMLDQDRVTNPERKKIYYSTMLHESERLSHLVENILDFARMEQGRKQYKFELGQIQDTISEAVETFRLQTEGKELELELKASQKIPPIIYDKEAIEQVTHNLLDNAFKYGGEEKRITVSVEALEGQVVIKVRDWGVGISGTDQTKVFDRFYRAGDELTSKVKGSGIGLTIVRQIIEDHKGKVTVHSKPGEGSTFTISLPVKRIA